MTSYESGEYATAVTETWMRLRALPANEREAAFVRLAQSLIEMERSGVIARRLVGAILAPGWSDPAISRSGEMTIATDLAGEVATGFFESSGEANRAWREMCEIFETPKNPSNN